MTDAPDLLDVEFYLAHLPPDERDRAAAEPWAHYLRTDGRWDPCPYFDSTFYRSQYGSELQPGIPPLVDYLQRLEQGEERQTHPLFDPAFYRAQLPELAKSDAALLHFLRHGDAECRNPSEHFDAKFYASCYLPLQSGSPLAHFVTEGRRLGYLPRPCAQSAAQVRELGPFDFLIIGHDAQKAGAPMQLLAMLRAFRQRGLRPLVLLHKAGPLLPLYKEQAPVLILQEGWNLEQIFDLFPRNAPVLTNTVVTLDSAIAAQAAGLQVLALIHELPYSISAWGMGDLCQQADDAKIRFGFSSTHVQGWFETLLSNPLPPERTVMFGPGRYVLPPQDDNTVLPPAHDGPVVIGMGHADHRKGFDLFLDAARLIQKARPDALIAWLGALTPWAEDLAQKARHTGLALHLPGHVDPVAPWLRRADALLLTARAETGPATLLEALCEGCRCIGFADGIGFADELRQFGWAVPGDTPGDLVSAALDALCQPRPDAQRSALSQRYEFDHVAQRVLDGLALPSKGAS